MKKIGTLTRLESMFSTLLNSNHFRMFLKNKVVLKRSRNPYPCLCEALSITFFVLRLSGIAPIVKTKRSNHSFNCKFKISKWWLIYSCSFYVLHFGFHVLTLSLKSYCGKEGSNWYLIRSHVLHLCTLHIFLGAQQIIRTLH